MKKLTLRKKQYIMWTLLLVGIVIFAFAVYLPESVLQMAIGLVLIIAGLVLNLTWWRCPHCGSYLSREQDDGDYCRKCGQRVFFDNHDDFQDLEEN